MCIGKSNLLDAVAFALALPLSRGKHAHVKELVYSGPNASAAASSSRNSVSRNVGDDDVAAGLKAGETTVNQSPEVMEMHVRLNFENGVALKRSYNCQEHVSE